MLTLICFYIVVAEVCFAFGYFLGWCLDQINDLMHAYIEGMCSLEPAVFVAVWAEETLLQFADTEPSR